MCSLPLTPGAVAALVVCGVALPGTVALRGRLLGRAGRRRGRRGRGGRLRLFGVRRHGEGECGEGREGDEGGLCHVHAPWRQRSALVVRARRPQGQAALVPPCAGSSQRRRRMLRDQNHRRTGSPCLTGETRLAGDIDCHRHRLGRMPVSRARRAVTVSARVTAAGERGFVERRAVMSPASPATRIRCGFGRLGSRTRVRFAYISTEATTSCELAADLRAWAPRHDACFGRRGFSRCDRRTTRRRSRWVSRP